jgi:phosphoglycerate dehydrogenase-like enzyme
MGPGKITFLDDDHVMRLTCTLLELPSRAGDERIRAFFAPVQVDATELRNLGNGIGASAGMQVGFAGDDHALAGSDVIVFRRGKVTSEMIERCPSLRLIQRLGAAPNSIDLDAAHRRGVGVSCLARRTLAHAAEHAILLMLALAKKLLDADAAVRTGRSKERSEAGDNVAYNWAGLEGLGGLHGRTLGIIGLGEIGTLVAQRARAFGMRVLYSKRQRFSAEQEAALAVEYRPLQQLLAEADFVTVHADNAAENVKLINREALACMRRTHS